MNSWGRMQTFRSGYHTVIADRVRALHSQEGVTMTEPRNPWLPWATLKPEEVRCVIVRSNPYTQGTGYNTGFAFSVPPHVRRLPDSLSVFLRHMRNDMGQSGPRNGDISSLRHNGVLLINRVATCRWIGMDKKGIPDADVGWEYLTYNTVRFLSTWFKGLAYILVGKDAWTLEPVINQEDNLMIKMNDPVNTTLKDEFSIQPGTVFGRCMEYLDDVELFDVH